MIIMELKVKIFNTIGLIVTIFFAFGTSSALASNPDLTASCALEDNGDPCIGYTASAWSACSESPHITSVHCENGQIVTENV